MTNPKVKVILAWVHFILMATWNKCSSHRRTLRALLHVAQVSFSCIPGFTLFYRLCSLSVYGLAKRAPVFVAVFLAPVKVIKKNSPN